ncbi:molybdate ABC transporter substrate-binding protein [Nakamurella flavida]|uniref:Molybdate ABC transporter substrate-binding protein n=1 Tax=Nakamurella flavida TaxID=363630 RepID=A0A938YKL9_9ACTN|nr:molybdate ABC transporter substrate-binding protein [Nakamurella flavida]MBM9477712.1 molybdate ABC transporter substrate-binding protein [Nakamurella flavida]
MLAAGCGSGSEAGSGSTGASTPAASASPAAPAPSSGAVTSGTATSATATSGTTTATSAAAATTSSGAATATSGASASGTITVFAAASLKATFTAIGETYRAENPGADVVFAFAGSSDLVTQLQGGAPADVFASADTNTMTKATDADLVTGAPVDFATNTLTIVTPPGNPAGITSFADLAREGVSEVICAPAVPCGSATKKVEDATGVTLTPVSEEQSVTDVLNKVETGEADAGLVYVTDATNAGAKVTAVPFAESAGAVNTYPIGVLRSSANAAAAQAFVDLVTGPQGQAVLEAAGFAAAG